MFTMSNLQLNQDVQMPSALGERIREARRRNDMTQGELAGDDYSVSYISAIERNKIRPSLRALAWLAARLGINLSDLLSSASSLDSEFLNISTAAEDEIQNNVLGAYKMFLKSHTGDYKKNVQNLIVELTESRDKARMPSQKVQINLLIGKLNLEIGRSAEAREALELNMGMTRDLDVTAQEHSRNLLGAAYAQQKLFMIAAEYHRLCLTAIDNRTVIDPSLELNVLTNLGNDLVMLGQFDEAIKIFQRAIDLGQKVMNPISSAEYYWSVSEEYRSRKQLVNAQRYSDLAVENTQQALNQRAFAHAQSDLGFALTQTGKIKEAEHLLTKAISTDDPTARSLAMSRLAYVQRSAKSVNESLATAQEALKIANATKNDEAIGAAYIAIAESYADLEDMKETDANFAKGISHLEKTGQQTELFRAYERYADILESRGEVKRALEYLKKSKVTMK